MKTRRILLAGAGFSLIEMAMSLGVIALVIGSVIVPLQNQVESRKIDETKRMLEQAREALLGYAAAYGYFPCPADTASNGNEPTSGVDHSTGVCPSYFGFLPAALLGLSPTDQQGYAIDSWGGGTTAGKNRIRYAIASQTVAAVTTPFTRSGGMAAANIPNLGAASDLLHVCASATGVNGATDCGSATSLTSRAVFVVWSVGANSATTGGLSADEAQNPNPCPNPGQTACSPAGGSVDRIFVSRSKSTITGQEFDDILLWTSPVVVVSRLIAAGQLP